MTTQAEVAIQYDRQGKVRFNPSLHSHHCHFWTEEEDSYLRNHYVSEGMYSASIALKRTEGAIASRVLALRKAGRMARRNNA